MPRQVRHLALVCRIHGGCGLRHFARERPLPSLAFIVKDCRCTNECCRPAQSQLLGPQQLGRHLVQRGPSRRLGVGVLVAAIDRDGGEDNELNLRLGRVVLRAKDEDSGTPSTLTKALTLPF